LIRFAGTVDCIRNESEESESPYGKESEGGGPEDRHYLGMGHKEDSLWAHVIWRIE